MKKIFFAITLFLVSHTALACECSVAPLGTQEARSAKNITVVQLVSSKVDPSVSYHVTGTLKIIRVVRGNAHPQLVRYSTYQCCGIRLEVGKYYVAFLDSNTKEIKGNPSNLLPLWNDYDAATASELQSVLKGSKELEYFFSYGIEEINQIRPPPPPPCPKAVKRDR